MKNFRIAAGASAVLGAVFLYGCSGSSGTSGSSGGSANAVSGHVYGSAVAYPGGHANSSASGVDYDKSTTGDPVTWSARRVAFANATVCVDANDDGVCGPDEDSAVSGSDGSFIIHTRQTGPLTAVVGSDATYVDPASNKRVNVARPMLLRAAPDQVQAGSVLVSALSSEVLRTMEADKLGYADAQQAIAAKVSLGNTPALPTDVAATSAQVLSDWSRIGDSRVQQALLFENQALQGRYALAKAMLDRGYVSDKSTDAVTTVQGAEAGAFAVEDIPRYDHLFVVIFENHSNHTVDDPAYPNFYNYLNKLGNKAANYFSTGNPSEPNYIAVGSGDTWGVTSDDGWNCVPDGDTADLPTDVYNPRGNCVSDDASHNQVNRRNLFTAMYQAGLGTRVYSESMDPGQDPRVDGKGNAAIMGANAVSGDQEPMISGLYKNKHHPAINFDDVRNRPDFFRNLTRSVGGGQWDDAIAAYAQAHNISWNTHQLEDDLRSGDVGALNFIIPDQCDDIHGTGTAVKNCVSGPQGIKRGDAYAKYLVDTIQASPLWANSARKVGIVFIFDEGSVFFGSSSCCGWNSGGGDSNPGPVGEDNTAPVPAYVDGNKGDGPTIFMVLNNQPNHPKGIYDSDTYSHFSFVRTLQDMFALADPAVDTSYMNRSKYTESYIAANQALFPEYKRSLDPHFDAVRPMNHHYVMKPGDRVSGGLVPGIPGSGSPGVSLVSLGPDPTQVSIWAFQ